VSENVKTYIVSVKRECPPAQRVRDNRALGYFRDGGEDRLGSDCLIESRDDGLACVRVDPVTEEGVHPPDLPITERALADGVTDENNAYHVIGTGYNTAFPRQQLLRVLSDPLGNSPAAYIPVLRQVSRTGGAFGGHRRSGHAELAQDAALNEGGVGTSSVKCNDAGANHVHLITHKGCEKGDASG
jgi:hypothetical protein